MLTCKITRKIDFSLTSENASDECYSPDNLYQIFCSLHQTVQRVGCEINYLTNIIQATCFTSLYMEET